MVVQSISFIGDTVIFIRNLLRTNVTDPLSRTNGVGFVMTAYPKRKVQHPIITIKQTNAPTTKLGMQSEVHLTVISLEVRVWARNSPEVDSLTAKVIDVLRDAQYSATGTDNEEIFGFKVTSVNPVVENEGDNSIHSKVIGVEYKIILT